MHIGKFKGDTDNLYPSLPEGNYLPQVSSEWRNMFLNPRKKLLSIDELIQQSFIEVSYKMSNKITPYLF